ncbi:MAG: hypothetical protein RL536_598 [Candidatus Parcubacteria bacterium]
MPSLQQKSPLFRGLFVARESPQGKHLIWSRTRRSLLTTYYVYYLKIRNTIPPILTITYIFGLLNIRYTTVANNTIITNIATQPHGTFLNENRAAADRPLLSG